jgi:hypothetical protein
MEVIRMKWHQLLSNRLWIFFLIAVFISPLWSEPNPGKSGSSLTPGQAEITPAIRRQFQGLKTNLFKRSIDLTLVYDGGPGKDGIPAITQPQVVSIDEALLKPGEWGVFVSVKGKHRFYPYNILVWHEIVNDSMEGKSYAVTFCPLCGSAIVFDREVDGEILSFGVSGKLYESNLLMYDDKTESLWSQAMGEAVVGDMTGTKLALVKMLMLTFAEVRNKFPDAQILSVKTGYQRDYGRNPYEGYDRTEALYFPISVQDKKFFAKEMMYVFEVEGKSVTFPVRDLGEKEITKTIKGKSVSARRDGNAINVSVDGQTVAGYYEMWFSWVTHHKRTGIVWNIKE